MPIIFPLLFIFLLIILNTVNHLKMLDQYSTILELEKSIQILEARKKSIENDIPLLEIVPDFSDFLLVAAVTVVFGLVIFGALIFLTRGGGSDSPGGGSTFFPDSSSSIPLQNLVKTDISVLNIGDKAKDFVFNSSSPAAGSMLSNENYGVLTKQIQNLSSDLLESCDSLESTTKLFGSFQEGLYVLNLVPLLELKSLLGVINSKLKVLRSKFSSELDSSPNLPVDTDTVYTDSSNILSKVDAVDASISTKLLSLDNSPNLPVDINTVYTDNSNILFKGVDVDASIITKLPSCTDVESFDNDFFKAAAKAVEDLGSGRFF